MLLMESRRETEVGKLDMTILVNEDVVRLDVSEEYTDISTAKMGLMARNSPMDETEFVNGLDSEDTLRHIEPRNVL